MRIPGEKLDAILRRHAEISARLSEAPPSDEFVRLSRDYAEIEPLVQAATTVLAMRLEADELAVLASDPKADPDMRQLACDERPALDQRLEEAEHHLRILLLPRDAADEKSAILEVRAGTGGDEASLFAGDLVRMYTRYAELHRWSIEVLTASEGTVGGFKEVIMAVKGRGVFARLKFESGVHRVQRVPTTEAGGRIHTSAATVAVLPEIEEVDVVIDDKDLKIDTFRASGAGGQHVNKTDSAIRITHLPTGIVVVQMADRSQHRNKAAAMQILRARIHDAERERLDAARSAERRGQVGSGDRSERIRTYNFPQGRVTDHRIELTLYKLDKVITGECLDDLIDPLIARHQADLLAEGEL